MAYNVKTSNKTLHRRSFYVLYIRPNDSSTSHSVFELSMKQLLTTQKLKPVPIPEDLIQTVNKMGTITNKIQQDST